MTKEICVGAERRLHSGLSNLRPEFLIRSDVMNDLGAGAACATVRRCAGGVTNGCGLADSEE